MGTLKFLKPFWLEDFSQALFSPVCVVCVRYPLFQGGSCLSCRQIAQDKMCVQKEGEIFSLFLYKDWFKDLLLRYKVQRHYSLYRVFSFWLQENLPENIDVIILAPCSQRRMRKEGVDPLILIGRSLARQGVRVLSPFYKTGLSQKVLTKGKREENIHRSLHLRKGVDLSLLKGQRILILDDIVTTGSTLREIKSRLEEAGVTSILQMVLAKSQFQNS